MLANIYLHYVLDLWFEKRFRAWCQGEANLTRFADDFVVCFQYKRDAERIDRILPQRMKKFGLELALDKTRMLRFGRFAHDGIAEHGWKPKTFDFLGFKHVSGTGNHGKFALVRIPAHKSCRKFLDRAHEWLKSHPHWRRKDQQRTLARMLLGFYQYFALNHWLPKLYWVYGEVQRMLSSTMFSPGQDGKEVKGVEISYSRVK